MKKSEFKSTLTIHLRGGLDGDNDDNENKLLSPHFNSSNPLNNNENENNNNNNSDSSGNNNNNNNNNKDIIKLSPYDTMEKYCNWHREHPHASTPRKLKISDDSPLQVCEEYPQLAYTQAKKKGYYKQNELSNEFRAKNTGEFAKFKEVTEVAHSLEHQYRLEKRDDYYDPWWMHSVKVQADIFHAKEENKNNIYKEEYDDNDILNDTLEKLNKQEKEREQKLREREEELAMSAYWGKPNRHIKTARHRQSSQSKYTINGKEELGDYLYDRFEQTVEIALNEYYLSNNNNNNNTNPVTDSQFLNSSNINKANTIKSQRKTRRSMFISTQLKSLQKKQQQYNIDNNSTYNEDDEESNVESDLKSLQGMSSSISIDKKLIMSSKSHFSTNNTNTSNNTQPDNHVLRQQQLYEDYKNSLGGEKEIKKITDKLVKYSKKINKENQQNELLSIADRGMDFLDACLHLNSIQVICLLKFGADPNTLTYDEEPVFYLIFQKIMLIDNRVLDEEDRNNHSERKTCLKILSALLEYGAEINCVVQNQTPLHITCSRGNVMMTKWLLEHYANPNISISNSGLTPLMLAAKFSYPECIVMLLKYEANINKIDNLGRTALHYAAQFGQTKIAKFLLRLGANKELKDHDFKTPGELAISSNHMTTSQAIIGFSVPPPPAKLPLEYISKRLCHDTKVLKPKKLFFFNTTNSSNTNQIMGNLFVEKEKKDSLPTRIYDHMVDLYRRYQMTPWNELFQMNSNQSNVVHPINE